MIISHVKEIELSPIALKQLKWFRDNQEVESLSFTEGDDLRMMCRNSRGGRFTYWLSRERHINFIDEEFLSILEKACTA